MLHPKVCHGHPGRVLCCCVTAESCSQINGGHGPPYECASGTADTAVARQWRRVAASVLSAEQAMAENQPFYHPKSPADGGYSFSALGGSA